ncbi:ParM/StbA family protein [Litchfieldia alkalitelluris]|uniref:ParM/StbA family protein n=1 Tax=Litchfieldia alkalitelluris TaxID=304268 RepID=UPI0009974746|nr:ParM/StbA family protein [Litchfieldia alkalitelluris]
MAMTVGFDWGNNEVKVAGPIGLDKFSSQIGEYTERNLESQHGKDDMVFEYKGRKGFAGTLALESDFGGAIMGDTKAHEDALIRVLLGLHRYSNSAEYNIIVGQPIAKHTPGEKQAIKEMIEGRHTIVVNDKVRTFTIKRCEVAAEGGAAFWSAPCDGMVRIIDVGSATVNCASIINKKYLNKDSFTLSFGMNTIRNHDLTELARGIARETSKRWKKGDKVLLVGGIAEQLAEPIRAHYPHAEIIKPVLKEGNGMKIVKPIYANAVGFYNIGRATYGEQRFSN